MKKDKDIIVVASIGMFYLSDLVSCNRARGISDFVTCMNDEEWGLLLLVTLYGAL